ncbi:MAG: hypothetical protein WKF89_15425 [Chitinophagaceae bacterium]
MIVEPAPLVVKGVARHKLSIGHSFETKRIPNQPDGTLAPGAWGALKLAQVFHRAEYKQVLIERPFKHKAIADEQLVPLGD